MTQIKPIIIGGNPTWLPEGLKNLKEDIRITFRFSKAENNVYRKRKKIPVSKWAERHRVVTKGPFEGSRYRNSTTPYLSGILNASFFPSVETVIMCTAPQVGKSFILDTCIGYAIDRDPGPVLYVYPDRDTATENSRDRILPMIQRSARLRSYLTGDQDDEASKRINLQHMQIYMAWAMSAIKLANKTIRYLVFDETDKYPDTAGRKEADPISLGEARPTWYSKLGMKIWKASTPTIENGPIWKALTTEAQVIFDYWVRCPRCGNYQLMEFETEKRWFRWPEEIKDPERIENELLARYRCRNCSEMWDDYTRDRAVRMGQWRSRGEGIKLSLYLKTNTPKKIGFHLPSWLSQFVSISKVAAAFIRGQTDRNKLKDFNNKHKAVPWKDYTLERKEDRILALRDDRPRGVVPAGDVILCLTAGVDTQDNGFWYSIRGWGWGMTQESWLVREGFIESFDALEQILFHERYVDAENHEYYIRFIVQDAMGHRTAQVYDFVREHPGRMVPLQGVDTRRMTQPMSWSQLEFYPGKRKPIPGGLKLLRADVSYYKNILAGKLEVAPEDPGAFHLHAETNEEYARHMCSEFINNKGLWECPTGRPNHYWDCEMMNLVAADVLRLKFQRKKVKKNESKEDTKNNAGWMSNLAGDSWLKT